MGFLSDLFGGNSPSSEFGSTPAGRWLNRAVSRARSIRSKNRPSISVGNNETDQILIAAFLGSAFSCAMFLAQTSGRRELLTMGYQKLVDTIREDAVARYGSGLRKLMEQEGYFTSDCNSVGELCQRGQGSLLDRIIPAICTLSSVWAAHALSGRPDVCERFVPARTPLTMFAFGMKDDFTYMVESFMELAAEQF